MSTVYSDLATACDLEFTADADEQQYLTNLMQAVNGLEEDSWKGLSSDAQAWFNDAAKLFEDVKDGETVSIPAPAGMHVDISQGKTSEDASTDAPEKPIKEPKAAKEPKAKKEKKEKVTPGARHIREILCDDYSLTLKEVMDKLLGRGVEMKKTSAQVVYLNTVRAFETAAELGTVKKSGTTVLTSSK